MLDNIYTLANETTFFTQNCNPTQLFLKFDNHQFFLNLTVYSEFNFLHITRDFPVHGKAVITFINQLEDLSNFSNLDNVQTIYHYSVPNTKLFYPEPFVASASFMHSDLWFVHILVYQYWLWFVFVFIIIFFL